MKNQIVRRVSAGAALAVSSGFAAAADVDVSAVVTAVSGAAAPIAAIGGAVLVVKVGGKVYEWVGKFLGRS